MLLSDAVIISLLNQISDPINKVAHSSILLMRTISAHSFVLLQDHHVIRFRHPIA